MVSVSITFPLATPEKMRRIHLQSNHGGLCAATAMPNVGNMNKMQMTYSGHTRALLGLGLPLIGGQLAHQAIGLTDTIMLGWYGIEALAAVTLAGSFFFLIFMFGSGFAFAVMPKVAAYAEANDDTSIRRTTRMGLWLSIVYGAAVMPLFWYSAPILRALGQEPHLADVAADYLNIMGWSIFPALWMMVLKSYLAALERTNAVFWFTVVGAVVNAVANYGLIFGNFGLPEMGARGAAIASVLTNLAMMATALAYAVRSFPTHHLLQRFWKPDWEAFLDVARMGLPIGATVVTESGLFTATAIMMGWLGTLPLAAHGVASSLGAAAFMVHVGLGNAATVRAGRGFGANDRIRIARGGHVAVVVSLAVSLVTAMLFVFMPETLINLFLAVDSQGHDEVLRIGAGLLIMAALFQTVDGLQVVALGLLRGLQDTKVPMFMATVSYVGVGMPMGYFCGFVLGWEGIGVWCGLVAGLGCAGVLLMIRFWRTVLPRVPLTTVD
jgi:MATE family multidrug resistance protein